jgi:Zn-dependent protease
MKKKTNALYVGKLAGTALYIHWTFLILVFVIFYSSYKVEGNWQDGLLSLGFVLTVFACITLHELGHIGVSRRFGYPARDITLYPIGGIASMERIPEKPYQELWMALAGPWVNIVIAGILFLVLSWTSGMPEFGRLQELRSSTFLYNLMVVNITLALFNLVPAFPMDGGRVFRALLSLRMDRLKATRIAARVGQLLAVAAIIVGVFWNWWLILIGLFIIFGASGEAFMELTRAAMVKHSLREVIMRKYTLVKYDATIEEVMRIMLDSHEKTFVAEAGGGQYAALTGKEIVSGLQKFGPKAPVHQILQITVPVLDAEMSLDEAYQLMLGRSYPICPVAEQGIVTGVVDMENMNEFIAFAMAQRKQLASS